MHTKRLLALALAACCSVAHADDVRMSAAQGTNEQHAGALKLPARGSTMTRVEAAFGAPEQREAAVGVPPITRWDYAGFIVYFEHDKVIHSVVK